MATQKAVFQVTNTETAVQIFLGGTIKTHEILRKQHFSPFSGYVAYIFPIYDFLSKCPQGKKFRRNFYEKQTQKTKFWRKLQQKSHKNKTQKTKFLQENAAKIVLFEKKKTFFNVCSIFVKKKK